MSSWYFRSFEHFVKQFHRLIWLFIWKILLCLIITSISSETAMKSFHFLFLWTRLYFFQVTLQPQETNINSACIPTFFFLITCSYKYFKIISFFSYSTNVRGCVWVWRERWFFEHHPTKMLATYFYSKSQCWRALTQLAQSSKGKKVHLDNRVLLDFCRLVI